MPLIAGYNAMPIWVTGLSEERMLAYQATELLPIGYWYINTELGLYISVLVDGTWISVIGSSTARGSGFVISDGVKVRAKNGDLADRYYLRQRLGV